MEDLVNDLKIAEEEVKTGMPKMSLKTTSINRDQSWFACWKTVT